MHVYEIDWNIDHRGLSKKSLNTTSAKYLIVLSSLCTYNSALWQWMSSDPDWFSGFIKVLEQGVADDILSNGSGMN